MYIQYVACSTQVVRYMLHMYVYIIIHFNLYLYRYETRLPSTCSRYRVPVHVVPVGTHVTIETTSPGFYTEPPRILAAYNSSSRLIQPDGSNSLKSGQRPRATLGGNTWPRKR